MVFDQRCQGPQFRRAQAFVAEIPGSLRIGFLRNPGPHQLCPPRPLVGQPPHIADRARQLHHLLGGASISLPLGHDQQPQLLDLLAHPRKPWAAPDAVHPLLQLHVTPPPYRGNDPRADLVHPGARVAPGVGRRGCALAGVAHKFIARQFRPIGVHAAPALGVIDLGAGVEQQEPGDHPRLLVEQAEPVVGAVALLAASAGLHGRQVQGIPAIELGAQIGDAFQGSLAGDVELGAAPDPIGDALHEGGLFREDPRGARRPAARGIHEESC